MRTYFQIVHVHEHSLRMFAGIADVPDVMPYLLRTGGIETIIKAMHFQNEPAVQMNVSPVCWTRKFIQLLFR